MGLFIVPLVLIYPFIWPFEKLAEIFDKIADNIGFDVDRLFNILDTLDLKFDEFHIHDGNKKTCHLALSEGTIDIKKFKELAKKNNSYIVLEVTQKSDLLKSVPIFREI